MCLQDPMPRPNPNFIIYIMQCSVVWSHDVYISGLYMDRISIYCIFKNIWYYIVFLKVIKFISFFFLGHLSFLLLLLEWQGKCVYHFREIRSNTIWKGKNTVYLFLPCHCIVRLYLTLLKVVAYFSKAPHITWAIPDLPIWA